MTVEATKEISQYLDSIFQAAHFSLKASVEVEGGDYRVQLSGPDSDLVLARNAELMNALEYLANRAFARVLGREVRITFDANNYRSVREAELRLMAHKAAERVKLSRRPFTFEPMSASERRVVHLALVDDAAVKTESLGEGEDRKVVIRPA